MRLDERTHRREKRSNAVGVLALCITHLACNAPSSDGLYGGAGPGSATGGVGAVGGSGGFGGGQGGAAAASGNGGGGVAGTSGNGGAAGVAVLWPPDASVADAAVPLDAGVDAARSCGGSLLGAICWYLGAADESCNQVCAPRGGFDPATIEVVGTEAQGGSLEECSAVLDVLFADPGNPAQAGTQTMQGVGCHLYEDQEGEITRWWLSFPAFNADASLVGVPLACGCNE